MCGRFTQRYTWSEVLQFLRVFGPPRNLQPHYNIAPTMTVDVTRLDKDGKRELVPMRWGLIPAWWAKSVTRHLGLRIRNSAPGKDILPDNIIE